jgi:hypothetical protein
MINFIKKWWRSHQFNSAMKRRDYPAATKLLRKIRKSGNQLSWQENLYRDYLKLQLSLSEKDKTLKQITQQLKKINSVPSHLRLPSDFFGNESYIIPHSDVINTIIDRFKMIKHDASMLQCTSIDRTVFDQIESHLADFIQEEFNQYSRRSSFETLLNQALQDINRLKQGQDPDYCFELSPHVYLIRYFLENVYCAYLAWFLIYQAGLLPTHLNVLDIAAGPSTIAYGLDLFLETAQKLSHLPSMQVSYYSLEKQASFQYRGLQFWRRYIEQKHHPSNVYFRFDTHDIFDDSESFQKIPRLFFDFIFISHCLFYNETSRKHFHDLFNQVFLKSLKPNGYVLLIVQDKKLFKAYNLKQHENSDQEKEIIQELLKSMGLKLSWYKYLTSTDQRGAMKGREFGQFASNHLPPQIKMSQLTQKYLGLKYDLNYTLDDYIILAQK